MKRIQARDRSPHVYFTGRGRCGKLNGERAEAVGHQRMESFLRFRVFNAVETLGDGFGSQIHEEGGGEYKWRAPRLTYI